MAFLPSIIITWFNPYYKLFVFYDAIPRIQSFLTISDNKRFFDRHTLKISLILHQKIATELPLILVCFLNAFKLYSVQRF